MNRDEWIVNHIPAVEAAVTYRWRWLSDEDREEVLSEVFLALTQAADRLAAATGEIDPQQFNWGYVITLTRNTIIDFLRHREYREKYELQVKFSALLAFCRDFSIFNGYSTDYKDRGSYIPMSEDMGEDELAALEAFLDREPKSDWQRTKLKRQALNALQRIGVNCERIHNYTTRSEHSPGVDGSVGIPNGTEQASDA